MDAKGEIHARVMQSVRVARPILETAEEFGIEVTSVLLAAGLDPTLVRHGETRIGPEQVIPIFAEVARRSQGASLAVAAAERLRPDDLGGLESLLRSCETMRDAVLLLTDVFAGRDGTSGPRLSIEGRNASVELGSHSPPGFAVFAFAIALQEARLLTGRALCATEVHLVERMQDATGQLERFFGGSVHFGGEIDRMVFPSVYLDLSLPKAAPESAPGQDSSVLSLPEPTSFVDRVKYLVAEALREGNPSVETLARQLRTSPRTLQRRLQENGTSFQALIDEARRSRALRYVERGDATLSEVAKRLGFAGASAFSRAFRRWTSMSPGAYRQAFSSGALPRPGAGAGGEG